MIDEEPAIAERHDIQRHLINEPADVYHAKAIDYLSSHQLAVFRWCPKHYHQKCLGLVPDYDSPAFREGRAAHTLILEGRERYEAEFAVGGPTNEKTGKPYGRNTRAYTEWAASVGKPLLNDSQAASVEEMAANVSNHAIAAALLRDGTPEGVVRAEYGGHECQARIDWLNPLDGRGIVDLKTCTDLDRFEYDLRCFDYIHQMAFYRELLVEVTGVELEVHLVAVEKCRSHRCGVWQISRDTLDEAADENLEAMAELTRCQETGVWPTRYEHMRVIDEL